ncbi:hypothetical protein ScPMuIL_004386 [Solemya velum]
MSDPQTVLKYTKQFHFFDEENDAASLNIAIPEVLDPSYGMYVWPCAPVLAQYIWYQREYIRGKRVLEIGAGTALPGIVAAKCGADVVLSDSALLPKCLENTKQSCLANGLMDIPVLGITWGDFNPDLLELGPVDIILGSDCFYDTKDFEPILVTISFLIEKNPQAMFWTTYQVRSADRSVEYLLEKWELGCLRINLDTFGANKPCLAGSQLPGNHTIEMLVIERRKSSQE